MTAEGAHGTEKHAAEKHAAQEASVEEAGDGVAVDVPVDADTVNDRDASDGNDEADIVEVVFLEGADVPVGHKSAERMVMMRAADGSSGTSLYFTASEWAAFIAGVKDGEFDDLR